ncbi:hypothetical protein Tco_1511774, partial [Tanacetum coccineum]
MSTLVFVDPESSTQADGAQSSRVPVPLPEDPYDVIRQAYLDRTDTESEPFEDATDTETPESPLTIAPPVLVIILRRTARMAVRFPHAMSSGLSASMVEVAAMSKSALRKRFRSSCESSPFVSPPDLPLRKRYRGTSELVKSSEEDDNEEDEEIEESMDSDSVSEDAEDERPTAEDEDLAMDDKGLTTGVKGPGMDDEDHDLDDDTHGKDDEGRGINNEGHSVGSDGLGLEEEEEAIPGVSSSTFEVEHGSGSAPESKRPERVSAFRQPTLTTWIDPKDGMIYIDILDYPPPVLPVQTPPSPKWTSGSLSISASHFDVPSPMIHMTVPSPIATPTIVETEGFLTELEAQVEMQGVLIDGRVVRLEELSPALFESLEYEHERVAVTFGAIWRPVLALEAWAGGRSPEEVCMVYEVWVSSLVYITKPGSI